MSDFRFGCARNLYKTRSHPRLLFGQNDIPQLRKLVATGPGCKVMEALRARVGWLTDWVFRAENLAEELAWKNRRWNNPAILTLMALDDMAFIGLVDGNGRAQEAVGRIFEAVSQVGAEGDTSWRPTSGLNNDSAPYGEAFDIAHGFLPDHTRQAFMTAAQALIRHRVKDYAKRIYKSSAGNITLGAALAPLPMLLAIEGEYGVNDLATERTRLISYLEAVLHSIVGPDGYPEEDIGYGTGVTCGAASYVEMTRRAGLYDAYRECPRYARFGRAILHFVQPWGEHLSNTGDHGDDIGGREFCLARIAAETRDPALLWLVGTLTYNHGIVNPDYALPQYYIEVEAWKKFHIPAGYRSLLVFNQFPKARHPARCKIDTAFRERGRGIVSFRSGWEKDDSLLIFDGSQRSPAGPGHYHDSCGHFSFSALGEYFAIDTGRYNIEQSCHNVVLVDGKSGRSTDGEWRASCYHGNMIDYRPGRFCDEAAVDSSHQHNCYWARRWVGLVKGRGMPAYAWTVEDVNKNNDWGEFWWQLHSCPENEITIEGLRATIKGWKRGNCLDIHFVLPDPESYLKPHSIVLEQDEATNSSYKYTPDSRAQVAGFVRPAAMVHGSVWVRPRLLAKVAGYNGRFMALMLPRRAGAKPALVEKLTALDNSLAVRIAVGRYEDTIIFAYEHNLLEANEIRARGQWCAVRREAGNRRIVAWELGHGTSISVAGKKLKG